MILCYIAIRNGLTEIEVRVRVSARSKRISIKIAPTTKEVELVIPRKELLDKARKFLFEKELWILNKLSRIKAVEPAEGLPKIITILGDEYELILNDPNIKEPIKIIPGQVLISNVIREEKIALIMVPLLKKMIKAEIISYASIKAEELKVKYNNITIRDTSSRWGSCSSTGNLSFSWRLILAPKYVLEYVVAHELCHLIEMNHSHRFWRLVNNIFPRHHEARLWIKRNGKNLHNIFKM